MGPTERELRRKILILEEDITAWKHWHCYDNECYHHMCKVRSAKLHKLDYKVRCLYVKWRLVRECKRADNILRIQ